MWTKKKTCKHVWKDYRFRWVEYMPHEQTPKFAKEGSYILSHVFCTKCGEVREVVNEGNKIRYKPIP